MILLYDTNEMGHDNFYRKNEETFTNALTYNGFGETIIKFILWFCSFCACQFMTNGSLKAQGVSYLVFALSLLIEYMPKFQEKVFTITRMIHIFLCLTIVVILIAAVFLLFSGDMTINKLCMKLLPICSLIVLASNLTNILLFIPAPRKNEQNVMKQPSDSQSAYLMKEKLIDGKLGSLDGGNDNG